MSRDLPLVSVVIPAHNQAKYLGEAVESVLNQDYPNVELIVLDDGSTDGTPEVLEKYAGRFYWESQENMGQSATLNKGWRMSGGDVLAYLSSDDVLLPHAVSTSVKHLTASPDAVLTYCDFDQIDPSSRFIRTVRTLEMSYPEMVSKFVCLPGPGAFFLRSAFEATGGWDEGMRRAADLEYWLRLGLQGRMLRIPRVLALWRIHEESSSFAEGDKWKSEEYVYAISKLYRTPCLPPEVEAVKNEAFSNAYISTARSHLTSKRYVQGAFNLVKALLMYPQNLSLRTLKVIAYGLFNQPAHRLLRRLRELSPRLRARASRVIGKT